MGFRDEAVIYLFVSLVFDHKPCFSDIDECKKSCRGKQAAHRFYLFVYLHCLAFLFDFLIIICYYYYFIDVLHFVQIISFATKVLDFIYLFIYLFIVYLFSVFYVEMLKLRKFAPLLPFNTFRNCSPSAACADECGRQRIRDRR